MKPISVIATGDLHCDEGSRFDEFRRVCVDWLPKLVAERKPDLVVIPGDVYDGTSTPDERLAAAEMTLGIAEHCPIVIAAGNHDPVHELLLLQELRGRYAIDVFERPGVALVSGLAVGVVPWPRMAAGVEGEGGARDQLRALLTGLREPLSASSCRLLIGHFLCEGAETSAGQPLTGGAISVALGDLALAGAQAVVMAHIHKPQSWEHGGVPMLYTGSPFRTAFGEVEEKSVLWLEIDEACARYERIPTPARQMLLVQGAWVDVTLAHDLDRDVRGAEVRLRFQVAADQREPARKAACELRDRWLADGAVVVKLEEEVLAEVCARAPEVATAKTTAEKLFHLWASRGDEPPAERAQRLLGPRLAELEEAAA